MEFRLLGAVEIHEGGRVLALGPPQQRQVMAALAADAGRPVPTETLIDRVWDEAPHGARRTLQVQLTRIRRVLEQERAVETDPPQLVRRSGGYLLDVDPERVDVHRFRRLVASAREADRPQPERALLMRAALALWHGEPLSGLPGGWAARVREAWWQELVGAVLTWADAELGVGQPDPVIARTTDLLGRYPLQEPLVAALMRTLSAAGRTAEALDQYERLRRRLADELGADPGPVLQGLHRAILRGQLDVPPPARARRTMLPAQLPPDLHGFTGRAEELARLDQVLATRDARTTAMLICCVSGTAGVGKTTLAVHWAHRVADRFPDGQLYVNLRGFEAAGTAVSPAEAVRRFLDALDVPAQRIPAELDGQIALYRSRMAGQRMLVVLDNARSVEQVRPLLPGSAGNLVLVTSRDQMSSLVAAEGALPLTMDLLSPGDSRNLLASRLGAQRVAAEAEAVRELVSRCARLPLALAIVAGRAALHPDFPLAAIADELRHAAGRLDALAGDDIAIDPRTAFACSYEPLSPGSARLFRLLGLYPGPDIAVPAAASLAGVAPTTVRSLLGELRRVHLITEAAPGRYTLHDLLRVYAAELVRGRDTDADQRAALRRVLDHHLRSAHAASLLLNPHQHPLALPAPTDAEAAPEELDDVEHALAWFTAERTVLLELIKQAASHGLDAHAWQLGFALTDYLHRQGHWRDQVLVQQLVLAAAGRQHEHAGQAHAHRHLGRAYTRLGDLGRARTHLGRALDLYAQLDDPIGQGYIYRGLALVWQREGGYRQALDHAERALDLFRRAEHVTGQASSLNAIGWYSALLGDHQRALDCCGRALTLFQRIGSPLLEGGAWDSLGYAHQQFGDHRLATECYRHALEAFRRLGDRYFEADTLVHLGENHIAAGDASGARETLRQALTVLEELDHHDAGRIRATMDHLTT